MRFRKLVCILLAGALAVSAAGCGSKGQNNSSEGSSTSSQADSSAGTDAESEAEEDKEQETVTLEIWGGVPPEAGPQASIDLFNEEFKDKGIQAEYVYYVNDDNGNMKLETTLMAGEGIDAYFSYDERTISKRVESNMALDLTELCERDDFDIKELFGEDMVSWLQFDGSFYCVPCLRSQYGMMLNKDMFDEAGIPIPTEWTYSEFREIAKKLTHGEGENKVYGAFLNTQQNIHTPFQYFASQTMGGNWMYNEDGSATNFTDPLIKETAQFMYDLMNVDGSAPTHVDSVTQKLSVDGMFMNERTAMVPASWTVRNVKNQESYPHDFVTAFAPYPIPDSGEAIYAFGGVGDHLSINPKSPNIDAVWEYVKWYSTEGMVPMAYGGRIPLCKTIDQNKVAEYFFKDAEDLLDRESTIAVMIEPKEKYALTTITTKSSELADIFDEELEAILNDRKSIDEGLQDAKEKGDALLAKG